VATRRLRPRQRAINAVVEMDQSKKNPGSAARQIFKWRKIGVVATADRHRHVHPIDAPLRTRYRQIRHPHREREVRGLDEMPMAEVAVTEMVAEHRRSGNRCREALELRGGTRPGITRQERHIRGNFENFDTDVPLKREVLCGNLPADRGHFAHHGRLVGAINGLAIARLVEEGRAAAKRSRKTHLKAHAGRYFISPAQFAKYLVGLKCPARIAELAEFEHLDSGFQSKYPVVSIVRGKSILRVRTADRFQRGMAIEDQLRLTLNPTFARANFAVRERLQMRPEDGRAGFEYLFGGFTRHAADQ